MSLLLSVFSNPFNPDPFYIKILFHLIHFIILCYLVYQFVRLVYKVIRGCTRLVYAVAKGLIRLVYRIISRPVRFVCKVIKAIGGSYARITAKFRKPIIPEPAPRVTTTEMESVPEMVPEMESVPNLSSAVKPSPLYLIPMDTKVQVPGDSL
jgi:hypothetical protein